MERIPLIYKVGHRVYMTDTIGLCPMEQEWPVRGSVYECIGTVTEVSEPYPSYDNTYMIQQVAVKWDNGYEREYNNYGLDPCETIPLFSLPDELFEVT